jgi:hypothetical protein
MPGSDANAIRRTPDEWRGLCLRICHARHEHDRIYAENLDDYLALAGIAHEVVEFELRGQQPELERCLGAETMAIVGFNSQLDHCWLGPANFVDAAGALGIPVVHWILDHPSARWLEFTNPAASNARFLMVSGHCEQYFRRHARPQAQSAATSGVGPNRRSRIADLDRQSFLQRDIPCLIPLNLVRLGGSWASMTARIEQLDPRIAKPVRDAIARARLDLSEALEVHLEIALAQHDCELTPQGFHACAQLVEDMTQIWRRLTVFRAAVPRPVRIQTDALPAELAARAVAAVHTSPQATSMISTLMLMKSCRAVLSLGLTSDMLHDRVANALNAGCVAIVEDNQLHRRLFRHGESALLFRYGDDSLAECLDLVCHQPERAYAIAQAGFALRDDPAIRFGQFHRLLDLVRS